MKLKESKRNITESYYTDAFDEAVTAEKIDDIVSKVGEGDTWWIPITNVGDKLYALVFGRPHYEEDDDSVHGKIAYNDSYMKEYDIDWMMPYDEDTGDVWDAETSSASSADLDWWREEWRAMDEAGVFDEDEEDDDYDYDDEDDDDDFYESCRKRSKKKR